MKQMTLILMLITALIFTPATVEGKKKKSYTKEDMYYLSHAMMAENGYMSKRCVRLTGIVIINRRDSKIFPNTIKGVILQPGQYGCVGSKYWNMEPTKRVKKIAKKLLKKGHKKSKKIVYQSCFPQGSGTYDVVDTQYFCYL